LQFSYRGDTHGYNSISSIVANYEARTQFSSHELRVDVTFGEGISKKDFLDILGKLSPFTSEELFTVTVWPVSKEDKK